MHAVASVNDYVGYGPTHLSSLERGIDIGVQMQMQNSILLLIDQY